VRGGRGFLEEFKKNCLLQLASRWTYVVPPALSKVGQLKLEGVLNELKTEADHLKGRVRR
jgi:hypothetical protein